MRYAIVNTENIVINVIIYTGQDGLWEPDRYCIMIPSDSASPGDIYDPATQTFTTPFSQPLIDIDIQL